MLSDFLQRHLEPFAVSDNRGIRMCQISVHCIGT